MFCYLYRILFAYAHTHLHTYIGNLNKAVMKKQHENRKIRKSYYYTSCGNLTFDKSSLIKKERKKDGKDCFATHRNIEGSQCALCCVECENHQRFG